jgi:site-specific DNA-methyltransferase (adenine-specific)
MSDIKYNLIYLDPPRWYNSRKTGGERNDKTKFWWWAEKHYPLMRDKELLNMKDKINELSEDNCVMFMWATMPRLDFAIELMKFRWFQYKTVAYTWVKTNKDWSYRINPWYYTASNIELCIIWIKWVNKWRFKPNKTMINQIIAEWLREHSRKPETVRNNIDIMYPNLKKIEMFAREKAEWWEVMWNQIDKF